MKIVENSRGKTTLKVFIEKIPDAFLIYYKYSRGIVVRFQCRQ